MAPCSSFFLRLLTLIEFPLFWLVFVSFAAKSMGPALRSPKRPTAKKWRTFLRHFVSQFPHWLAPNRGLFFLFFSYCVGMLSWWNFFLFFFFFALPADYANASVLRTSRRHFLWRCSRPLSRRFYWSEIIINCTSFQLHSIPIELRTEWRRRWVEMFSQTIFRSSFHFA